MSLNGSEQIKIIGLEWGGALRLYKAGRLVYRSIEDKEEWQLADGSEDFQFNWLSMRFTIFSGYLDQQLNAGQAYTLPDGTVQAAAPAAGVMDVLNILKESNVTIVNFYPAIVNGLGDVDLVTSYRVMTNNSDIDFIQAERAGKFSPYLPVAMKAKVPLTDYPLWANR